MRDGPHPLSVHLGMAAASFHGAEQYSAQFDAKLSEDDAVHMMRGIQLYQAHNYKPQMLPTSAVWEKHGVRILRPEGVKRGDNVDIHRFPLLLIPSLINRSHILDIIEERSLLRWLYERGHDAYLLDWGDLQDVLLREMGINELIEHVLVDAIRHVSEQYSSKVNALGYCMGGTMLLGAGHLAPDNIGSMVLLASPWDFHAKSSRLARNVRLWMPFVSPSITQKSALPAHWVQALFASLNPEGAARKFIRFGSMDQDSFEAKLFVSVEDWLNDGVDIPKGMAVDCMEKWFVGNDTGRGAWVMGAGPVEPSILPFDIYVVASHADNLVSFDSASAVLKDARGKAQHSLLSLNCGHISMIVGRNAINDIWQPIHERLLLNAT